MAQVVLEKVVKRYSDTVQVVHGIDLEVKDKEFIVLVGPSGCAKSTTLRMVAGLEDITDGTITIGDRVVNSVPPRDRNIAMVFQDYALYPHMTVYENMAFSLKMRKESAAVIDRAVQDAAKILGLETLLERKPSQLSGGQRQRVAMGRAIVRKPDVFLFDEPLSNLDAKLRTQMRLEIKKLHMSLQTTTIYVTHDQVEAMTLADRIVIMKDGNIMQVGSPVDVYERPENLFVATFIGNPTMNILDAVVADGPEGPVLRAGEVVFPMPKTLSRQLVPGVQVKLGIRPEDFSPASDTSDPAWTFGGEVVVSEILGGTSLIECRIGGNNVTCEVEGRMTPRAGETMAFSVCGEHLHLFDAENGMAIR